MNRRSNQLDRVIHYNDIERPEPTAARQRLQYSAGKMIYKMFTLDTWTVDGKEQDTEPGRQALIAAAAKQNKYIYLDDTNQIAYIQHRTEGD